MKLAVIGDIHHLFNAQDTDYFNASDHDGLLFVGDIYNYSHQRGLQAAAELAALRKPAILIPGNHDAVHPAQLAAEITQRRSLISITSFGHGKRVQDLNDAVGGAVVAGYSVHRLQEGLDLIVGRPHSMGGPSLSFRPYLADAYDVRNFSDSVERLRACVDDSEAEQVVFMAHNGPTGLGDARDDIWGCDFKRGAGDFGDEDLREAIDYALECGKRVVAVVAGHMHHAIRGGGERRWLLRKDDILYVNAARVPRIFKEKGVTYHHHIDLQIDDGMARATEILRQP